MIPYLSFEFIRAFVRQNETASRAPQPLLRTPAHGVSANHDKTDSPLRENAPHKLLFIAAAAVEQWLGKPKR